MSNDTELMPCGHPRACLGWITVSGMPESGVMLPFTGRKEVCTVCEREAAVVAGAYKAADRAANHILMGHYETNLAVEVGDSIRALTSADAQRELDRKVNKALVLAWNAGYQEGIRDGAPYPSEKDIAELKATLGESR